LNKIIEELINKEILLEVFTSLKTYYHKRTKLDAEYTGSIDKGDISRSISRIIENKLKTFLEERYDLSITAASSNETLPDLNIDGVNLSLEIKVSTTNNYWQGGKNCNRKSGHHLCVYWENELDTFFACLVLLKDDDWKLGKGHSNARTYFYVKTLNSLPKENYKIIFGTTTVSKRNKHKVIPERI